MDVSTRLIKFFATVLAFCFAQSASFATVWRTSSSGAITTLSNWSNGTSAPSTFATPGDSWFVTLPMTLSGTWTVGTSSSPTDTVTINGSGSITTSGAGSTSSMDVNGDLIMNGGRIIQGGASTTLNLTVFRNYFMNAGRINMGGSSPTMNFKVAGNYTMVADTLSTGSAGGTLSLIVKGNYLMTGGFTMAGGAGATLLVYIYGNYASTGTAAMTSTGAGTASAVHFALSSGTMLVHNVSTGTWSGTNVYVDTGCTAQLDSNFSTTTGSATFGVTVNGTLICPSAYVVNGTRLFTLNGSGKLVVAATTGINGAITTSGTMTFNTGASYEFNGTAAQVTGSYLPASLGATSKLIVSNTAGVSLSQTTATDGVLAFTAGRLNTGSFTMTAPGSATGVTGAGASSYVNGTLIKPITGFTSVNYEVGDTDYAPLALTFSSSGTSGSLGVKTTLGLHPSVATSGLSTSNMANHYWTVTNSGAAGPSTVTPKATYNAVDILGGSNASFVTQCYASSAWLGTSLTTTNTSSPYTSVPASGIALSSLAGQYIFGNISCGAAAITGASTVCVGATINLTNATSGGTWSSATTSVATISSGGVVTGVSAGTTIISYTVAGCTVTTVITVNPAPSAGIISGVTSACIGLTTTLTASVTGGTWSSASTGVATVNASGVVTGVTAGTAVISYTVTNACGSATATATVTVGATLFVAPITGVDSVCPAHTTALSDTTGGGVWTSLTSTIATISSTGVVTGVTPGYDTVTYAITNACGTATAKKRIKVRSATICHAGIEIEEIATSELQIFPNPATDIFTVRIAAAYSEEVHIIITNLLGEKVKEITTSTNKPTEIALDYPAGVYLIYAVDKHQAYTGRVVLER